MKGRIVLSLAYCASLALIVINAVLWPLDGTGFVAGGDKPLFLCADLMSSGGDDDAIVFLLAIFTLPLALRLLRFKKSLGTSEIWIYGACWGVALLAYWLTTLDCADVWATFSQSHDLQIAIIGINLMLSFLFALFLFLASVTNVA